MREKQRIYATKNINICINKTLTFLLFLLKISYCFSTDISTVFILFHQMNPDDLRDTFTPSLYNSIKRIFDNHRDHSGISGVYSGTWGYIDIYR